MFSKTVFGHIISQAFKGFIVSWLPAAKELLITKHQGERGGSVLWANFIVLFTCQLKHTVVFVRSEIYWGRGIYQVNNNNKVLLSPTTSNHHHTNNSTDTQTTGQQPDKTLNINE